MLFPTNAKKYASTLLLSFTALSVSNAAQVTLKNGDVISGKLIRLTDDILVLKSPVLGELKIPFGDVSTLSGDDGNRIALEDGSEVVGKIEMAESGELSISGKSVATGKTTLPRDSLLAINKPLKDLGTKYSGRANLGGTFNRGNSDEDTFNLDAEWVARAPDNRVTVGLEINEGSSAGVTTTSNRLVSAKYDLFLSEKNYVFANIKGENDDLADLKLRSTIGGGYGRQFWETDLTQLSAEAGLSYVNEDYDLAPDESFPSLSLGLKYDRKLFDKSLILFNNSSLSMSLEDSEDTLFKNKLGVRFPVAQGLNLSTQLNLDYDNKPALGAKKTDTSLIFSVGYGF